MRTSVVALLALVLPPPLVAQTPIATAGAVAARYSETYNEIENLRPLSDQVATVHHLVLSRDAGELTLEDGKLYLLPVNGSNTQWHKNLLKNPSLHIDAGRDVAQLKAVPFTDPQQVASVVEKFRAKYGAADVKKYYSKFDTAVLADLP